MSKIDKFRYVQELNSIFGMSCTNPLKAGIYLNENYEWKAHTMSDPDYFKFVQEKLNDMKLDKDVVYYDTDSIKEVDSKVIEVVEEYNRKVDREVEKYSKIHDIPIEDLGGV